MVDAAQFAAEVRRAVEQTPYTVVDETADGFTVHIDVVDRQWWTLMYRKSLSSAFKHIVRIDPAEGTYTVTDQSVAVTWQAGADVSGGVPRPTLRAGVRFAKGTLRSRSFRKEHGLDDSGRPGPVVDYTFDSAEGNRLVDGVAQQLGLTKRVNPTAKLGIVVAIIGLLGALAALVVLLVLFATDSLG